MIKTQVIGRLGKDAIVNDVSGKKVINFNIATDTGYGENKKTIWVDCSKWGEQTGVAQYLKKGSSVFVEGEPSIKTFEGKNGFGASMLLRVEKIELIGTQQQPQQQPQTYSEQGSYSTGKNIVEPIDDLPF